MGLRGGLVLLCFALFGTFIPVIPPAEVGRSKETQAGTVEGKPESWSWPIRIIRAIAPGAPRSGRGGL